MWVLPEISDTVRRADEGVRDHVTAGFAAPAGRARPLDRRLSVNGDKLAGSARERRDIMSSKRRRKKKKSRMKAANHGKRPQS